MNLCIRNFERSIAKGFTQLFFVLTFGFPVIALASVSVNANTAIPNYLHASLEYQRINVGEEHQFLLSTPKRISNTLNIEKEVLLSGERHDLLLQIKVTGSSKEAFIYYQKLLSEQGEVSYLCEERACGSSNYWANSIFNESKLYGRDSEQYYLAGRLNVKEQNYFVSVYIVKNGRKQQYIYLSYVLDNEQKSEVAKTEGLQPMKQLRLWQQGISFEKPSLNDEQLTFLIRAMDNNPDLSLWLVGFAEIRDDQKVVDVMDMSEKAVSAFRIEVSRKLNISAERIIIKNIGPFDQKPEGNTATWFRLYLLQ